MQKLVLVTRPIEQAKEFAAGLNHAEFIPLIHPLLHIHTIPFSFETIEKPDAILLTSMHGVGSVAPPTDWLTIPVFTVGLKTEDVARAAGFKNTYSGATNIDDVIPLIRKNLASACHILYLRGEHVQHDIKALLPEYHVQQKITYKAIAVDNIDDNILDSFPKIDVLTLFSARSGQILKNLLTKHSLLSHLQSIKLLCLSHAVLESVQELNWKSCHVAEQPSQQSMIKTLERIRNE